MSGEQEREWLTVGQAAKLLHVSDTTLRAYADKGLLDDPIPPGHSAGGHRRIHRRSVERLHLELYGRAPD